MRLTKHSPAKIWLGADDNRPRDYLWRRHLRRPEWSMENLGCQTSGAGAGPKSSTTNAIPVHPRMGIWILSNQPARSLEAYTTSPIPPEPPRHPNMLSPCLSLHALAGRNKQIWLQDWGKSRTYWTTALRLSDHPIPSRLCAYLGIWSPRQPLLAAAQYPMSVMMTWEDPFSTRYILSAVKG
jgi:hypothetical protein